MAAGFGDRVLDSCQVLGQVLGTAALPPAAVGHDGLPRSTASKTFATSAGSHTDGTLACLTDLAAGTVSSTPRSTSPPAAANRNNERTAHSLCSTVFA